MINGVAPGFVASLLLAYRSITPQVALPRCPRFSQQRCQLEFITC